MKKRIPKKNSIDGTNFPDSRLEELLDRCVISIKDFRSRRKKKEHNGTKVIESAGAPTTSGGIHAQKGLLS